jgi:HSP20 family protein
LPEDAVSDSIKAEYNSGVLMLHIPKKETAKQKPVKEITVS